QVVAALLVLPAAVALVPGSLALRLPRWAALTAPGTPARHATPPALGHERGATAAPVPTAEGPSTGISRAARPLMNPIAGASASNVAKARSGATMAEPPRLGWSGWLALAYAAGVLVLLARLATQHRVVARLSRRATPVRDGVWGALAADVARTLGIRTPVALLRGDDAVMPMTWGVRRPAVLLPSAAEEWPAARRRAVLLHEYAHVARHDCLTQLLAALACVLYWPHPGVWWAAARLREERELACDDLALGRGLRAHDYAAHLLAIARQCRAPRTLAALPAAPAAPSALERRLRAALDDGRARGAPSGRSARMGAVLTTLVLLTLAAVRGEAAPARAAGRAAEAAQAAAPHRAPAPPTEREANEPTFPRSGVPAAESLGGTWTARAATTDEVRALALGEPAVHVALRTPGLTTFYVPLARLEGLGDAPIVRDAAGREAPVRFRLRRDAGAFTFEGAFRRGRGTGQFAFAPDPAFAVALARRGMAAPTAAEQLSLAKHGAELDLLDALAAERYATPTTAAFVALGATGVSAAYVREMAALGYRLGRVEALVRLWNNGVDPAVLRAAGAVGARSLPIDSLLRLPARAASLAPANDDAAATIGPEDAPRPPTAAADVPAADVAAYEPGDDTTPLAGRWVAHATRDGVVDFEVFWSDGTNWRQALDSAALRADAGAALSIAQDAGTFDLDGALRDGRGTGALRFRPARGFGAVLASLGVRGADAPSDHQLKNLAWGGISAAAVREFLALGYGPLTLRDAQDLAIFQVTPAYARAMRALGVAGTETVPGIVDLRHQGVPVAYARAVAATGEPALTARALAERWRATRARRVP
ncbi:MAG TPA: M56 family metallopeptidase, partial [Gemmatirosa sp.]|nr:M56 family metallopeptidase [Gemmatirosa sp.]